MACDVPDFARLAGGPDAVAEFFAFTKAVGHQAVGLLLELSRIHNYGPLSDIPANDDDATNTRDLYCRIVEGWAVFYTASAPHRITIVYAATLNPHSFGDLETEAESRLRRLGP